MTPPQVVEDADPCCKKSLPQVQQHAIPGAGHDKEVHGQQTKYSTDSRTPARALPDRKNSSRHSAVQRPPPRCDVKEKHQVGKQQQIELGARPCGRSCNDPRLFKVLLQHLLAEEAPTRAQIKIASMLTTKLPLLMGANSVSM